MAAHDPDPDRHGRDGNWASVGDSATRRAGGGPGDNGPAYKSTDFLRFIASRPELAHVRTRHHAPETNGVVERFNQTIKDEHLYRLEIPNVIALAEEALDFRQLYNTIRPHESLDFATPISRDLAHPGSHLSEPGSVQET